MPDAVALKQERAVCLNSIAQTINPRDLKLAITN